MSLLNNITISKKKSLKIRLQIDVYIIMLKLLYGGSSFHISITHLKRYYIIIILNVNVIRTIKMLLRKIIVTVMFVSLYKNQLTDLSQYSQT